MNRSNQGIMQVLLASTCWGTAGMVSQFVMQSAGSNPLSVSFLRLGIAAPVLLLVAYRLYGKNLWAVTRRDFALMMLHGVLVGLAQAMYFAAIALAGVAVSTLLTICAAPVLVILWTALKNRRLPDSMTLILITLALAGTVLLVSGSSSDGTTSVSLTGVLLAFGAAAGTACMILLGRFLAERVQPLQVTAVGFATGAILSGILAGSAGFVGSYPALSWLLILYLGLVPTAFAYTLFVLGMRTTPAPVASVLVLMEPLTATLLAWVFGGERPGAAGVIGAVLLLGAIYRLSRRE